MNSLAAPCQQLVDLLQKADNAWLTPLEVARRFDGNVDATTDLLADLDVAGWLLVQEREDGLYVTLSPSAIRRLSQPVHGLASSSRAGLFPQVPVAAAAC